MRQVFRRFMKKVKKFYTLSVFSPRAIFYGIRFFEKKERKYIICFEFIDDQVDL